MLPTGMLQVSRIEIGEECSTSNYSACQWSKSDLVQVIAMMCDGNIIHGHGTTHGPAFAICKHDQ